MKFIQEILAEELFKKLQTYFKEQNNDIQIIKEGAGVNWNCSIISQNRETKIYCCEYRNYDDIKPEYLISFDAFGKNIAWGRTYNINEAIESSSDWINNKELELLYKKLFSFIDWSKRIIEKIDQQLVNLEPNLLKVKRIIDPNWGTDLYQYAIHKNNRSCKLVGPNRDIPISFAFYWDEAYLFEIENDNLELIAKIIKEWLLNEINPSALKKQYNWLEFANLAEYYEKGEGIKGEFIESWISIENFYSGLSDEYHPFKTDAIDLIKKLKNEGLDKKLRAGQSIFCFILSRSRRHGLDINQSSLRITFLNNKEIKIKSDFGGEIKTIKTGIGYHGDLKNLIHKLLNEEIN